MYIKGSRLRERGGAGTTLLGGVLGAVLLAGLIPCLHAAPSLPRVRFMYQNRVADAASIVAVHKGYFAAQGLQVSSSVFTSGPETLEALALGRADIATMGDTTSVIAVLRSPSVIIASHGGGENRHRIMVKKNSPLHRPSDLAGKSIAVKKGTSTYGGLLAWLHSQGLSGQVHIVDMRPPDMPDALLSGAVDAIVASEPTPSQIEAKGLGRQLATLAGQGTTYPIMLVVRKDFLRRHRPAVVSFLKAMILAASFVRRHPDQAAQILGPPAGLTPAVAARSMRYHYYKVSLDQQTRTSLKKAAGFLKQEGLIPRMPDWSKVLDSSPLQEAFAGL